MSSLLLNFQDNSQSNQKVYVGFVPGLPEPGQPATPFDITNAASKQAIKSLTDGMSKFPGTGNWYDVSSLTKGVEITSFSGRIYFCIGDTWQPQHSAYEPGQAVTDPNFFVRYDKIEITFTGSPNDVANLTSIDYWAIPLTLKTYQLSQGKTLVQTVAGLKDGATAKDIYTALSNLSNPPKSGLTGPGGVDGQVISALVPGDYKTYPKGDTPPSAFCRIIGPSSYPPALPFPGAVPVIPYDIFNNYLGYLYDNFGPGTKKGQLVQGLGEGICAVIEGQFAGVGPTPPATGPTAKQAYSLKASINANYDLVLKGTVGGEATTMIYPYGSLLNPAGIYGGNAAFYLNSDGQLTTPGNDVYGWIGGDLFSGFAIGAIGSQTKINGVMIGAMNSQDWFSKIPTSDFFAGLQSATTNYNQWAAALAPLSDAYNFSFTDRFAAVFASLNPATVNCLEITLEDTSTVM